jgi:glutamine amidotransferase
VVNTLNDLGLEAQEISGERVNDLADCDLLVLPGTGSFGAAVERMASLGAADVIKKFIANDGPVVGLCLGMQLFFQNSQETPGALGLSVVPGKVTRIPPSKKSKVHIGWSRTTPDTKFIRDTGLTDLDLYYLHSFKCVPDDETVVSYKSEFAGQTFCAGVRYKNVVGLQFHPEKSAKAGVRVLDYEIGRLLA